MLDLFNLILEKEFRAVSVYIDSDFIEAIITYLSSSDALIIEKTYFLLGNLIAERYSIAVEIALNPMLINLMTDHSKRCETRILYDLSFFLKNLAIKIERLPDESFMFTDIGELFRIIKRILLNSF